MPDDLQTKLAEVASKIESGNLEEAGRICESVVEQYPNEARAWIMLGAVRHREGRLDDSIASFRRAMELAPNLTGAWNGCAAVLVDLGRKQEAETLLRNRLAAGHADVFTLANLANVLELQRASDEALSVYERALELDTSFFPALLNRGQLLLRKRRFHEALANNLRLCSAHPQSAAALLNLAETQLNFCLYDESLAACRRALELEPATDRALLLQAFALAGSNRIEEAQQKLDRLRAMRSDLPSQLPAGLALSADAFYARVDAQLLCLFLRFHEQEVCDWNRRDEFVALIERFATAHPASRTGKLDETVAFMTFGAPVGADVVLALVTRIANDLASGVARVDHHCNIRVVARRPIRVAYVSPDFREHPTAYLTRRLYGLHDRERFEVFAYALERNERSAAAKAIAEDCDVFRDVHALDDKAIAECIADDGIDIAIDLSGYGRLCRPGVFARRPAPLQVNYLGFPASLGAGFIDYALLDRVICPAGSEIFWREQVVRLPSTYLLTNNREEIKMRDWNRSTLGLPDKGVVFCCFNNSYKLDPLTFDLWMNVLRQVEHAVLWLYAPNEIAALNLGRRAAQKGVEASRLVFAPYVNDHGSHLGRYAFADVFLDTRYCNAHTTAVDALWCGVPVLTVPGETMASRVGASLLNAVGLPELICKDWTEYEEKAVWLAAHPDALAAIKRKLAANRDSYPLFDTEGQVRALEAAYEEMWRRHQAGLPPAAFDVKPLVNRNFRNAWH